MEDSHSEEQVMSRAMFTLDFPFRTISFSIECMEGHTSPLAPTWELTEHSIVMVSVEGSLDFSR